MQTRIPNVIFLTEHIGLMQLPGQAFTAIHGRKALNRPSVADLPCILECSVRKIDILHKRLRLRHPPQNPE